MEASENIEIFNNYLRAISSSYKINEKKIQKLNQDFNEISQVVDDKLNKIISQKDNEKKLIIIFSLAFGLLLLLTLIVYD